MPRMLPRRAAAALLLTMPALARAQADHMERGKPMTATRTVPEGGYRFVPGVYQYSAGVAAEPGFTLQRVRFAEPVPLTRGFARIAEVLEAAGRPKTAFAACELRSPAPFTEATFAAFNRVYGGVLAEWGLFREDGLNPVARSNVCPEVAPPTEPSFHAFTFTVPDSAAPPSFAVAGSAEAPEGKANYHDYIIAPGDTSPDGLRTKARWVLGELERRLGLLGANWAGTTAVQAYSVHDIFPVFAEELLIARGAARGGLTWQFCRPPVVGLDYEMDCRGVWREQVLPVS
jgi:hypothetical protein